MLDQVSYPAGGTMAVTVTLKDAWDNGIGGCLTQLQADAIALENALLNTAWNDLGDGSYSTGYTALKAGVGLQATLKLADWASPARPVTYGIVPGDLNIGRSGIATDKALYCVGETITVTVTLMDAAQNPAVNAHTLLTPETVTLTSAEQTSDWVDNGDGSYIANWKAHTAGTGLQAALKLAGWSAPQTSTAYDIASALPVSANSSIALDKDTYTAGDVMTVSVGLQDKDKQFVTRAAALLMNDGVVTVPNAQLQGDWTCQEKGNSTPAHYQATYIVQSTGANLKATLKLSDGTATAQNAYSITAGAPEAAMSSIITDKSAYTTGDELKVTVTLRDAGGNGLTKTAFDGASATCSVQLDGASLKDSWKDNGDGSYSATWLAQKVGTNQQAMLRCSGWKTTVRSAAFTITEGNAEATHCAILTDKASYQTGERITVTARLADAGGNGLNDALAQLAGDAITVPNATLVSDWIGDAYGNYYAAWAAGDVGDDLEATLKLAGWSDSVKSAPYSINRNS
jgi:adhesin/invasin